jgi:hypothetical protein
MEAAATRLIDRHCICAHSKARNVEPRERASLELDLLEVGMTKL